MFWLRDWKFITLSHSDWGTQNTITEWTYDYCYRAWKENSSHVSFCCTKTHQSVGKRPAVPVENKNRNEFLMGATTALTTLKLSWKTNDAVWVGLWPLEDKKLSALKKLVDEQLQKGHIKPKNSPWNSPVFVIHKKNWVLEIASWS